jgi:Arc/MetJ-type ribon-helix-helix transcriptional regulator
MEIHLTPEQERMVKHELESGHFRSAEEVITEALVALERANVAGDSAWNSMKQDQAVREMLDFAEKNRTQLQGISVKQLIHEGHRL